MMPVPTLTRDGDREIDRPRRASEVSTSSTLESSFSSPRTVSGDQLCILPIGRIFQPLAAPQFASCTHWFAVTGSTVHSGEVTMSPAQLLKRRRNGMSPPGSPAGGAVASPGGAAEAGTRS